MSTELSHFAFTPLPDGTYSVKLKSKNSCPEEVVFPSTYNGRTVSEIGANALKGYPFGKNTSVKRAVIPKNIKTIGEYAFYYCTSLVRVDISDGVERIGEEAFACCDSLEEITLPDSVISVGNTAFRQCRTIKRISIPASVRYMGAVLLISRKVASPPPWS